MHNNTEQHTCCRAESYNQLLAQSMQPVATGPITSVPQHNRSANFQLSPLALLNQPAAAVNTSVPHRQHTYPAAAQNTSNNIPASQLLLPNPRALLTGAPATAQAAPPALPPPTDTDNPVSC